MEIKDILNDNKIIGVVSNYKSSLNLSGKVRDLNIKNISKALLMVGLDDTFLDKNIDDLTISELWKLDLVTKLDKDIIVIGNLGNTLIFKDLEYMKKLFVKLSENYNKKIVIIDSNINSFIGIANKIVVLKDKNIVYETNNVFDSELYEYVSMPKIIEFIKYVNERDKNIIMTTDIYELIKDIYRRVS